MARHLGPLDSLWQAFGHFSGQRSYRPHLSKFCCNLIYNISMILWTKFHDHRMQYWEINSNLPIYINIIGVPKLLEGSVHDCTCARKLLLNNVDFVYIINIKSLFFPFSCLFSLKVYNIWAMRNEQYWTLF